MPRQFGNRHRSPGNTLVIVRSVGEEVVEQRAAQTDQRTRNDTGVPSCPVKAPGSRDGHGDFARCSGQLAVGT